MRIIGLDLSFKASGFAVLDQDKNILKTGVIKNPLGQTSGEYYGRIRDHISYIMDKYHVKLAVLEDLNIMFNTSAKRILPIHGVLKELVFLRTEEEAVCLNVSTWRHKILGIKKFTAKEKAWLEKYSRNKTHYKHLINIKHKDVRYVNKVLGTKYHFEDHDIVDAICLVLAHLEVKK